MDEGWTRFIFDKNEIPYKRLVDADIRKGGLSLGNSTRLSFQTIRLRRS